MFACRSQYFFNFLIVSTPFKIVWAHSVKMCQFDRFNYSMTYKRPTKAYNAAPS